MTQSRRWLFRIACLLSLSCGAPRSTNVTMGNGPDDAGSMTADSGQPPADGGGMMTTGIPDPGTVDMVDNNFGDIEPNNTAQEATPLGTAMSGSVYVWVNENAIGGSSNPADYFVFRSGAASGTFSFDICFGGALTAMTASLWEVSNGAERTPALGTWNSSAGCVTNMSMTTPLVASTEYLFGLTATGGVGSYSA